MLTAFASVALAALERGEEATTLRRGLESNREIGKAVGLLMAMHDIDDDRAFEMLAKVSQEMNVKVAEVAAQVVAHHRKERRRRPRGRPDCGPTWRDRVPARCQRLGRACVIPRGMRVHKGSEVEHSGFRDCAALARRPLGHAPRGPACAARPVREPNRLKECTRMGIDDKAGNKAEDLEGKVKETTGKATDDESWRPRARPTRASPR